MLYGDSDDRALPGTEARVRHSPAPQPGGRPGPSGDTVLLATVHSQLQGEEHCFPEAKPPTCTQLKHHQVKWLDGVTGSFRTLATLRGRAQSGLTSMGTLDFQTVLLTQMEKGAQQEEGKPVQSVASTAAEGPT